MNDPVSFGLAKLLKERGFNNECELFYSKYGSLNYLEPHGAYEHLRSRSEKLVLYFDGKYDWNSLDVDEGMVGLVTAFSESDEYVNCECSAPTIAEAVMWLYDKHRIWISVGGDCDYRFTFEIHTWRWCESGKTYRLGHTVLGETFWNTSSPPFDSPTEAYEAAIGYILKNLIT